MISIEQPKCYVFVGCLYDTKFYAAVCNLCQVMPENNLERSTEELQVM